MTKIVLFTVAGLVGLCAQQPGKTPAQRANPTQTEAVDLGPDTPVYRVTVVSRTIPSLNYRHRGGATKVDFRGTALMPKARGEAKVESKQGYIEIEVEFDDITVPASNFGPEFVTYVMWAITPEGRATNLGEVILNGTESKLNVTTELQAFGLLVTAEPYFAVAQPSDVVVMENVVRSDTQGKVDVVDAKYELLKRGVYTMNRTGNTFRPVSFGTDIPLELSEARNALSIARHAGADKYASDTFQKAENMLKQAEDYHARKQKKPTAMAAREAVQTAEDSRLIAIQRQEEERLAAERAEAARKQAEAKARADQEAEMRRQAEADRSAAERLRREAEAAASAAAQQRAAAESARATAHSRSGTRQAGFARSRSPAGAGRKREERVAPKTSPAVESDTGDARDGARLDREHV